jgi:GntR family transcriptional regulator, rspAB operon transcriptional repressor
VVEGKLAEALAISRTPLREALGRLEGEGLLLKGASRSFSVRSVSAREFFESLKVRETLESEAAELAAGRVPMQDLVSLRRQVIEAGQVPTQGREHWLADNRLHATVAVASGNAVLAALVRSLRITTQLFEIKRPLARVEADRDEHLAILEALAAEDGAKARRAMRLHLRNLRADVMLLLSGD